MFNYKVFLAEFIGTFALVFVGSAAGVYGQSIGLLGIALAFGLTVTAFIYVYGPISGGHFNPAVTLGLALNGTVKWLDAVVYWVAEFAGAIFAAFLLRTFLTPLSVDAFKGAATSGLLTDATQGFHYYALGLEALLTFFLVSAVLHAAVDGKAGQFAGLAIGLTLAISIMAGGPLTGASLNPARSFGPAIFTSALDPAVADYQNPIFYLVYFVGPLAGAILAVLIYQVFKYEPMSIDDMEDDDEIVEFVEEIVVEEPVKKPVRKSAVRKTTSK